MPRNDTLTDTEQKAPFFNRVDWFAFWSALAVCFIVYFHTLAPTVTLEDSGELAVAGDWLGVPHPPGYPIWTMTAWVFTKIFAFVKFRGHPNPAWSIAFLSAVLGALSAGITALLICRSGRDILRQSKLIAHSMSIKTEDIICGVGGFSCSLLFAFTPIMWSQAVIVEVYTLNAFFLGLVMLFTYLWIKRPNNKTLFLASFLFGLGLTNYQVILLAGVSLAICIMLRNYKLFRDFVFAAIPYALIGMLIMRYDKINPHPEIESINDMIGLIFTKGALPTIIHPTHITAYVYMFLNFAWMSVIYFLFPYGKTVAPSILFAQLGLAFYAYMPIVSDLRNPPMNWGYPRTWEGFIHAITRGQYEKIVPAHIFTINFIKQMGVYFSDLRINYSLPIAMIGFLPFAAWRVHTKEKDYPVLTLAIILAILTAVLDIIIPLPLYKISALAVVIIAAIGGTAIMASRMENVVRKHLLDAGASIMDKTTTVIVLLGIAGTGVGLVLRDVLNAIAPLRVEGKTPTHDQVVNIIRECTGIGLIVLTILLAVTTVFWLVHTKRIKLSVSEESQQWLMSTTVTFVVLSIGLIALANLKLDIQDTFIQRVKFISSHMFFAFWVGYGIIFLLSYIDGVLLEKSPTLKWLAIAVAALLPITPLLVNEFNDKLLYVYGGAEQNGHDFGWQFGNYQLRGAEAIMEELTPDEEPLPNPTYPPAMEQGAIFFGGTDPGRFVPTYMIYSADVRYDVFLITQNALADNTYMNVMRDLYGNDIWIPSAYDSAQAFSTYIQDIESGKRPMTAGIIKENGRVQISGILGVMEVNGILAKDIFDYNKYKHAFYVEESYVIRWMYPYLQPHGLIMKINHDRLPRLTKSMLNNDTDFWDWYTRRLTTNRKFIRDTVARKSFSKLRSAIAGLYASRGLRKEAETAFTESCKLYPLSPEANFRLAEVYMSSMQFNKAADLIIKFHEMDPANTKALPFLERIKAVKATYAKIKAIENETKGGRLATPRALELAEYYRQIGQIGRFKGLLDSISRTRNIPPQVQYQVALAYAKAKYYPEMNHALDACLKTLPSNTAPQAYLQIANLYAKGNNGIGMANSLNKYLRIKPKDWRAWLDLASIEIQLKHAAEANAALNAAIRYGGNTARQEIVKNPLLNQLIKLRASRTKSLINMGMQ